MPMPALKNDYADWLSPMLVKELRQGVRNRAFVSTFIFLQVAMVLTMLVGLLAGTDGNPTGNAVAFWAIVGVSVLLVLPLSGMNAVGGEIKANTLELIFLTRLSSLRIVAGKWLAVFVSSGLLVCAVLPYLVLRYFLGGVNITNELVALGSMLSASALLTAVTVGLSAYQARVARGAVGLGVFLVVQGLAAPLLFFGSGGGPILRGSGPFGVPHGQVACLLACGALLLVLMLDFGASRIAPLAENHSAIKRLLAFALLGVAGVANLLRGEAQSVTILAFVLCLPVCAGALCEQPRWIPSIYRPFAARGFPGRFLALFLAPGWHTGVWFTSVIFAGFAGLMFHLKMLDTLVVVVRLVAGFGSLLLPVAFTRLFFPKTERPLVFYLVVLISCLVLTVMAYIIDQTLTTSLKDLIAFLPISALLQSADTPEPASAMFILGAPLVTLGSWLLLLVLTASPLGRDFAAERASLETTATPADGTLA